MLRLDSLDGHQHLFYLSCDLVPKHLAPLGLHDIGEIRRKALQSLFNFESSPHDNGRLSLLPYEDTPTPELLTLRAQAIADIATDLVEESRLFLPRCRYGVVITGEPWFTPVLQREIRNRDIDVYYYPAQKSLIPQHLDEVLIQSTARCRQLQLRLNTA
jgi:hypothetical protein